MYKKQRLTTSQKMDPIYSALFLFERREFQECADVCTDILEKDPYDEMIWSLKTRALTGKYIF